MTEGEIVASLRNLAGHSVGQDKDIVLAALGLIEDLMGEVDRLERTVDGMWEELRYGD